VARKVNRLTARSVAAATKPGLHADGAGLYLRITDGGTKSWMFRYMLNRRAHDMGLGSARDLSLAEAREEVGRYRKSLRLGIDPLGARRAERDNQRVDAAKLITFRQCAESYIESHHAGWKNAKHAAQWSSTLASYAFPIFGDLPVQVVDTSLVMKMLEPIWRTRTETASRVRGRIEAVLDWATVRKFRSGENPARWKGHLDKLLPARTKVRSVEHHAALPYDEIGTFMVGLREQQGFAARGLEFAILTAARTGEVIYATWDEFDLPAALWIVPGHRMKAGKEHRVPLSTPTVAILEKLQSLRQSDFVFPGARPKKPLSNMAFLQLLRRMERSDLTTHGFRSTFRDWAAESTACPSEVVEMALAHTISNKVEAAYRRGDLFEKRRRLMEDWATQCSTNSRHTDNVGGIMGTST
jgi:integrase